jgi:hypothetical protein
VSSMAGEMGISNVTPPAMTMLTSILDYRLRQVVQAGPGLGVVAIHNGLCLTGIVWPFRRACESCGTPAVLSLQ